MSGGPKTVKIGIAQNPKQRLKQLQTGNPNRMSLVMTVSTRHAKKLECAMHNRLAEYRMNGEWFRITAMEAFEILKKVIHTKSYRLNPYIESTGDPEFIAESYKLLCKFYRETGRMPCSLFVEELCLCDRITKLLQLNRQCKFHHRVRRLFRSTFGSNWPPWQLGKCPIYLNIRPSLAP